MTGPLDGWDECSHPGCPSWDPNATAEDQDAFDDSDGWWHGKPHVHFIDHYLVKGD